MIWQFHCYVDNANNRNANIHSSEDMYNNVHRSTNHNDTQTGNYPNALQSKMDELCYITKEYYVTMGMN